MMCSWANHASSITSRADINYAAPIALLGMCVVGYLYAPSIRHPQLLKQPFGGLPALRREVQLAIRRQGQQLLRTFRHVPTWSDVSHLPQRSHTRVRTSV